MGTSIPSVIEQQTRWAKGKGFEPKNAYMMSLADNLRQELSSGALRDFERGSGSELRDRGTRPPRMHALRSSAALSVNVFDYWRSRDPAPLQYALKLRNRITQVTFEEQFPTGLKGNPPNVDVLLTLESNQHVAIESKFTGWLSRRERSIDPKYFPPGERLWAAQNLPNCQELADAYRECGPYKFLDAPRLLKHALGLARKKGADYELCYLYFEWKSAEGDVHAEEVAEFGKLVRDEVTFRALTYQQLFAELAHTIRPEDAGYLDYLTSRYAVDS
jgi:hypothetical protein